MTKLVRVDLGRSVLVKFTEEEAVKFLAANPGAKRWAKGATSVAPDKTDKFFPPEPEPSPETEGQEEGRGEPIQMTEGVETVADLAPAKPKK